MALQVLIENNKVLIEYTPANGVEWINEIFEKDDELIIKRTFHVTEQDLVKTEDEKYLELKTFVIGELYDDYYRIYNRILSTKYDVLFHKSFDLKIKSFIANKNISILHKLESLANQQIIIGGDKANSIPKNVFRDIINSLPTRTELFHYVDSRITNVLTQYLEGVKDSGKAFERYLEKRNKIRAVNTIPSVKKYEFEKYNFILVTLKSMLEESDSYSESDWQQQILEIVLLLYPKYINCFPEVKIKDYYTKSESATDRFIDLMLVDSNGNIDLIEIKKPFRNCVITKNTYRDNYTPLKELSGTIMQIEKYLFHLNKWGIKGEQTLSSRYESKLPNNLNIKITNPKGIIIIGRDYNLGKKQLFDLEIIKRKYANVVDIITYDDLIQRLENVLTKFK